MSLEDDSLEGSYDIPMKDKYTEGPKRIKLYDRMIQFIQSREITTYKDLIDEFGDSGHSVGIINKVRNDKRVIKKNCLTGRCTWYEISSK